MKKGIVSIIAFTFFLNFYLFSQTDNIYGEYLLNKVKKKISMNLENVQLTNLLKALSIQSGLNFICTETVKEKRLTVYLDKVPLKKAIDIIFRANGLSYEYYPEVNLFVVKEVEKPEVKLQTKIYKLKYIRVEGSRMDREVEGAFGSSGANSSGGEVKSKIKEAVESVLSEYGKVIEEPLTNSLIVADIPSRFPLIEKVIKELDKPQPKVLIEAEILDVSKTSIDKLGIRWPEDLIKLRVTGTRLTAFPFWGSKKNVSKNNLFLNIEKTPEGWKDISWSANNFGPSIFTVIGAELALKFFESQSDTKLLARPKVLTLSGETAEIKITTDEAIGVEKTESTEGGTIEYTIERAETGTTLKVTPQVNLDSGEITLAIEVAQKIAVDSGFTTQAFIVGTIKNPEERSTRTVVRLKDGEVLLVGGLIRRNEEKDNYRVPFLSRIPILGNLFKEKDKNVTERELLVFLTPRIVEEAGCSLSGKSKLKTREQSISLLRKRIIASFLDKFSK